MEMDDRSTDREKECIRDDHLSVRSADSGVHTLLNRMERHRSGPELQRFVAKLMGATSYEAESSHAPMLSNSALVIHVIRTAAESIAKSD